MDVAIDTSVLIALLIPNDVWHTQAVALWQAMKATACISRYFDCVAAEAISTAVRRLREKGRIVDADELLVRLKTYTPSHTITWILPEVPRLYEAVLELIVSSGGELNFNDALIALACRERGITAIASFDADFDRIPWLRRLAKAEDVATT